MFSHPSVKKSNTTITPTHHLTPFLAFRPTPSLLLHAKASILSPIYSLDMPATSEFRLFVHTYNIIQKGPMCEHGPQSVCNTCTCACVFIKHYLKKKTLFLPFDPADDICTYIHASYVRISHYSVYVYPLFLFSLSLSLFLLQKKKKTPMSQKEGSGRIY